MVRLKLCQFHALHPGSLCGTMPSVLSSHPEGKHWGIQHKHCLKNLPQVSPRRAWKQSGRVLWVRGTPGAAPARHLKITSSCIFMAVRRDFSASRVFSFNCLCISASSLRFFSLYSSNWFWSSRVDVRETSTMSAIWKKWPRCQPAPWCSIWSGLGATNPEHISFFLHSLPQDFAKHLAMGYPGLVISNLQAAWRSE